MYLIFYYLLFFLFQHPYSSIVLMLLFFFFLFLILRYFLREFEYMFYLITILIPIPNSTTSSWPSLSLTNHSKPIFVHVFHINQPPLFISAIMLSPYHTLARFARCPHHGGSNATLLINYLTTTKPAPPPF